MSDAAQELCRYFLGWQCRIRQLSAREEGGRPSEGTRPVLTHGDPPEQVRITTVLVKREPQHETAQFRHMVRKTPDASQRYESAVRMLSAEYYQHPETFSDELTAVFALESPLAESLAADSRCVLDFRHSAQSFRLPCAVRALVSGSEGYEATYWHNLPFNPALPGLVSIVAFRPDWASASANPPI